MKKLALLFLSVLCISLVSCRKESHYSIRYTDYSTAMANVTLFEYDYSFDLVKTREIKNIEPGVVYDLTSSDLSYYVVIGVEGVVGGRILKWYSAHYYELEQKHPIHIDVSFTDMETQGSNPVNTRDSIQGYIHK